MSTLASVVNSARRAVAASYLVDENFESGVQPSGWTAGGSGTIDWGSTDSPLAGARSLKVYGVSYTSARKAITGADEINIFFTFKPGAVSNALIFGLRNGTTTLATIEYRSDRISFYHGSAKVDILGAPGVVQNVLWLRWVRSTASNGVLEVYINKNSSSRVKPALSASLSTGTATLTPDNIVLFAQGSEAAGWVYDDLKVSTSPIGSNP